MIKTITNTKEFDDVLVLAEKTIIKFGATWCGPCRSLDTTLEKLEDINIGMVDVEECQEIAADFNVRSIPAMFFMKDGEIVDSVVGAIPESTIRAKFDKL